MTADWHPVLAPSAMLRHDRVRARDVLLLPERVVFLKGSAGAILALCDGRHTQEEIAGHLTGVYGAGDVAGGVARFLARMWQLGWVQ
jgi:pyrroloquinoline quinone biosynthesis protein D